MPGPDRSTLETYFRLMNLNGSAEIYHAALRLGVYQALEDGPKSAVDVAESCGTQVRPTKLLLAGLRALGLLDILDSGDFCLTDVARMLLYSEYRELGNQYWRHLSEFLRTGQPLKKMDDVAQSESHYQAQAAVLGWMLSHAAEEAAVRLKIGMVRRNLSILDVGAGSGIWSLTIASHDATSRVTAVDWTSVLEVTRETAEQLGVQGQLTTLAGNFHEVLLPPAAFDMAIVANVCHLQTPEQNVALFQKLQKALRSGGEIVVVDAISHGADGELSLALYELGLALRTQHGRVYAFGELQQMLGAGFEAPRTIPLSAPPHVVGLLVAKKCDSATSLLGSGRSDRGGFASPTAH